MHPHSNHPISNNTPLTALPYQTKQSKVFKNNPLFSRKQGNSAKRDSRSHPSIEINNQTVVAPRPTAGHRFHELSLAAAIKPFSNSGRMEITGYGRIAAEGRHCRLRRGCTREPGGRSRAISRDGKSLRRILTSRLLARARGKYNPQWFIGWLAGAEPRQTTVYYCQWNASRAKHASQILGDGVKVRRW